MEVKRKYMYRSVSKACLYCHYALSDPHREGFEPPFSENLRWLHSWRPAPNCQSFWFVDFSELPTLQ